MPTPKKYSSTAEKSRAQRERERARRLEEQQAKGLPAVAPIPTMPSRPRWTAQVAAAVALLEASRDEQQSYHDERSESWQESDAGTELAARIEAIENALAELESAAV
jgi:hypothetical protein